MHGTAWPWQWRICRSTGWRPRHNKNSCEEKESPNGFLGVHRENSATWDAGCHLGSQSQVANSALLHTSQTWDCMVLVQCQEQECTVSW